MKITRIDVFRFEYTAVGGGLVLSGGRVARTQDSTIVKVSTDEGLAGWGEVCPFTPTYMVAFAGGARAAIQEMGPALLGADPRQVEVVYARMDGALHGHAYAKSAVDMACWDLFGQAVGRPISDLMSEAAVPLAIPLLLFSTELAAWLKLARSLLVNFGLACVSAMTAAGAVGWFFRGQTDEWWKVAGMLVGVYVGGTANMSAIGLALQAKQETFVLLNAADVVAGGLYLLFLLTVGQRIAMLVLPHSKVDRSAAAQAGSEQPSPWRREHLQPMALAFGVAVVIVGASAGASFGLFGRMEPPFVLLLITSLGIAASLQPAIRRLPGSYDVGEYTLLVFCVAVGSLADVRLLTGSSPTLMLFVFAVMTAAIALHVALAALFRLDADATIITSTATIFGPAFIGPVAASLKNRQLVAPGLTMGLAGIALGTYLGLALSYLLKP